MACASSRYGPSGRYSVALDQPEVDYIEDRISPAAGFEASGSQQALAASVWTDRALGGISSRRDSGTAKERKKQET